MSAAVVVGLLEDDDDQAAVFETWLTEAGYRVQRFAHAAEFRRKLGALSVDILILDWMLPDQPGPEVLDWLRHSAQAELPVIFVTARTGEQDIVAALKAGADDYVTKPPRRAELLARIETLLRRTGVTGAEPIIRDIAPFEIDTQRRRVVRAGQSIDLTDREFDLATFVFRRPGRVISREALLSQVWNVAHSVTTRTVDTHMSRLRKKLELNGEHGWRLTAVYQHGYRLEHT
jgi:DNA-binding response OmpR family regulator